MTTGRRLALAGATGALVAALLVGCGQGPPTPSAEPPAATTTALAPIATTTSVTAAPTTVAAPSAGPAEAPRVDAGPVGVAGRPAPLGVAALQARDPSPPVALALPTLRVRSELEQLHLHEDGTLAAPVDPDLAGWYAEGPQPGQPGPAVLAGHVDSSTGPAVFHRLGDLAPGDPVVVERADGSAVTFVVTAVAQHAKDAFPTEAVYGPTTGPELRLITCGGTFDRRSGHYRDNVVVAAIEAPTTT